MISYLSAQNKIVVSDDSDPGREPIEISMSLSQQDIEQAIIQYLGPNNENNVPPLSRRQAFLVLAQFGLLSTVRTFMDHLNPDDPSRIVWETAIEFHRNDQILEAVAVQLNLTDEQIDIMFEAGALL